MKISPGFFSIKIFIVILISFSLVGNGYAGGGKKKGRKKRVVHIPENQFISPDHNSKTWAVRLIPDTSQTLDTTEVFGEDSDYIINPQSFTDNNDGTVTDNVTGLMWQKGEGGEMTWQGGMEYCNNLGIGGYDNWRLPGSMELINLVDHGNPMLNDVFTRSETAEYWWTSSMQANKADTSAWEVNKNGGTGAKLFSRSKSAGGDLIIHVRCVRDPSKPRMVTEHFTVNNDGTVLDNSNGLIWQQADGGKHAWGDSLKYCEALDLAGKDDWRLPNVKELRSMCDETLMYPSLDKRAFPDINAAHSYWSSSYENHQPTRGWMVTMVDGKIEHPDKSGVLHARCVRGGDKLP